MAVIQKIPTPTLNIKGKTVYGSKSTVDFMGIIKPGIPLAFEAKEHMGTKTKEGRRAESSFPLIRSGKVKKDLITEGQRKFLRSWKEAGGIGFVIIRFYVRNECFNVPIEFIDLKYKEAAAGGPKSIPYNQFKNEWKVDPNDYLGIL